MGFHRIVNKMLHRKPRPVVRKRPRPLATIHHIESLEPRLVLFAATGNAWPTPQIVTLSFQPDGTNLGGVNSNLNQAFNKNSNLAGRWQTEIIRAAQTWAEVTNINFVVVTDSGLASGGGKYQQGDPTIGDIRIGGFNFGNSSLARAYMPPSDNNYSVAGDIVFNTGVAYGIGQGFDLYSVALHELGHALGLDHSSVSSSSVLWSSYNGIKTKLHSDDIAGIRSIYSGNNARSSDVYDTGTGNGTFASATNLTAELAKGDKGFAIGGLDMTTSSDVDFYKVTLPKWTGSSMTVTAQASNLSLLSSKLTVYAADQKTVLGTFSANNTVGGDASVTVTGVSEGETYFIKVEAADTSSFRVGNYGLVVDLGAKKASTVAAPKSQVANGSKPSGKGGAAEDSGEHDVLFSPAPVIQTISPDTGASSMDRNTSVNQITLNGVAGLAEQVEIYLGGTRIGSTISLLGAWSFELPSALPDGHHDFYVMTKALLGLGGYTGTSDLFTVTIDTSAADAPTIDNITPQPGAGEVLLESPTALSGTAGRSNLVSVYANGELLGTTYADGTGRWNFQLAAALPDGTYRFTATGTDLPGNVSSASTARTVIVDTAVATPVLSGINADTGVNANDKVTQARNLVLYGTGEAGSAVAIFRDGALVGSVNVAENGTWSFDYSSVSLDDGTYQFTARAVDALGHISDLSAPMTVVVDTTGPTPVISGITRTSLLLQLGQTITLQGSTEANSTAQLYVNGSWLATVNTDDSGLWSYQYTALLGLSGTVRFGISASDTAGNQSGYIASYDLVISSSAPTISNLALGSSTINTSAGPQVTTSTPVINGTATRASTVLIYDNNRLIGTAVVGSNGRWSFTTPVLAKGRHSLTAVSVAADGVSKGTVSAALVFQV